MAVTSVGGGGPAANLAKENIARNGGGRTEEAAKGGKNSDPADVGSITGGATVQQATVAETGSNSEGATGGAPPVGETVRQENISAEAEMSQQGKGERVNMRV